MDYRWLQPNFAPAKPNYDGKGLAIIRSRGVVSNTGARWAGSYHTMLQDRFGADCRLSGLRQLPGQQLGYIRALEWIKDPISPDFGGTRTNVHIYGPNFQARAIRFN